MNDIFLLNVCPASFICFVKPFLASVIEAVLLELFQIFAKRLSCDGHYIKVKHALDFLHDRRNAACIIEELGRILACRTHIQKIVSAAVKPVKRIACDCNAEFMRYCRNVKQRVCGAGDRRVNQNRVLEAFKSHDVSGTHVLHL